MTSSLSRIALLPRAAGRWSVLRAIRLLGPTTPLLFGPGRGLRLERDETTTVALPLGLYEQELIPSVRRLCRPGTICYDVGSLNGYYALVFSRLGGATVVAFDSDPAACARIARNVAANPTDGARVRIERSYLAYETNPTVNAMALDDFVAESGLVPALVKIDVEGAEEWVLNGARGVLSEHAPALIVETHSAELEERCAAILGEAGYAPVIVAPRSRGFGRRPAEHNRWLVAASPGGRGS